MIFLLCFFFFSILFYGFSLWFPLVCTNGFYGVMNFEFFIGCLNFCDRVCDVWVMCSLLGNCFFHFFFPLIESSRSVVLCSSIPCQLVAFVAVIIRTE